MRIFLFTLLIISVVNLNGQENNKKKFGVGLNLDYHKIVQEKLINPPLFNLILSYDMKKHIRSETSIGMKISKDKETQESKSSLLSVDQEFLYVKNINKINLLFGLQFGGKLYKNETKDNITEETYSLTGHYLNAGPLIGLEYKMKEYLGIGVNTGYIFVYNQFILRKGFRADLSIKYYF